MFRLCCQALSNASRRRTKSAAVVVVLAVLYFACVLLCGSSSGLATLCSDDAFYYFKIARNIVQGQGCTFDEIAPTNGFHPLWMLCVLAVYSLAGEDLEMPVRIVVACSGILCLATLLGLHHVVQRHVAPEAGAVAVAICLVPGILSAMTNGMETGLLLFAIIILLWICYEKHIDDPRSNPWGSFAFGALLGIVALCRLDAVFFMLAAVCFTPVAAVALKVRSGQCVLRLLLLGVGFAAVVSPYLAWNMIAFGHLMPISGAVKSCFPEIRHALTLEYDLGFGVLLLAILWGLTVTVALLDRRRGGDWRLLVQSPLPIFVMGCTFHFAYAFLFLAWGVYWWHFAPYGLLVAITLAQVVDRLTVDRPRVRRAAVVSLALTIAAFAIVVKAQEISRKHERHEAWLDAAEWARTSTTSDAVFAIKDAGLFGYFSDRRVVNLDGKANSFEYLNALNANVVEGYLSRANVTYTASIHTTYDAGRCPIVIPRANRPPVVLWMTEDSVCYTSRPFRSGRLTGSTTTRFAIWNYGGEGISVQE